MKRENVEGDKERRWKKYYILWKKTLRRYAVSPLSTCLCLCSSCLSVYGENEWLGSAHGEAMPRPDIGIIVRRPQCSPIHSVNNTTDASHAYLKNDLYSQAMSAQLLFEPSSPVPTCFANAISSMFDVIF